MRTKSRTAPANGTSRLGDGLAEVRSVAHEKPGTNLHIVLDGFKPGKLMDGSDGTKNPAHLFEAACKNGKGDNWWTTEREMAHVGDAVRRGNRDWTSIKFYQDGAVLPHFDKPSFLGD